MAKKPNQHYVPQFILRGFAQGKLEQIHVFDKIEEREFVTSVSDNPVTLFNLIRRPGRGNLGVGVPGIEIHLPISSHLAICFFCEQIGEAIQARARDALEMKWRFGHVLPDLRNLATLDEAIRSGGPLELTRDNVMHQNWLQLANAWRFLFSADGDFTLAKEAIRKNPELKTDLGVRFE